jgi:hypothetical protein
MLPENIIKGVSKISIFELEDKSEIQKDTDKQIP